MPKGSTPRFTRMVTWAAGLDPVDRPDAEVRRRGAGRRHGLWFIAMAMLIIAARPAAGGFSDSTSRHAGGLTVDLAVIPASFVLGHSPEQTGQGMHGGRPTSRYSHHLIVAVFDSQSGSRVTDATVGVFVTVTIRLIMRIWSRWRSAVPRPTVAS